MKKLILVASVLNALAAIALAAPISSEQENHSYLCEAGGGYPGPHSFTVAGNVMPTREEAAESAMETCKNAVAFASSWRQMCHVEGCYIDDRESN